jgi:soluble lytic murein transglycosylase-like protein
MRKLTKTIKIGGKVALALIAAHGFSRGVTISESWIAEQSAQATEYVTTQAASYGGFVRPTPQATELDIDGVIEQAALGEQVNISLLRALGRVESGMNPNAISPRSAIGLYQIMPANLSRCGLKSLFQLLSPRESARCGAKILKQELITYNYNVERALWAYNGGGLAVTTILKCGENNAECLGGYTESVNHARLVLAAMARDIR